MMYVSLKENTVDLCPSAALEPYKGTDALWENVLMPAKGQHFSVETSCYVKCVDSKCSGKSSFTLSQKRA